MEYLIGNTSDLRRIKSGNLVQKSITRTWWAHVVELQQAIDKYIT